jgi:glycosyltransferase involved in cell wall biosynthesis
VIGKNGLRDKVVQFRRLVINGKFLGARPTGVHRVAEQLVLQLSDRRAKLIELFHRLPEVMAPGNVRRTSLFSFGVQRGGLLRGQLWEQLDLPRLTKPDLLLNLCNLGPIASTAAITMIHDAQVFITPASYTLPFAIWYRNVLPELGRRHAKILTVSAYSAAQLVRFGIAESHRITVVPNGVDHLLKCNPEREIIDRLQLSERNFVVALASLQVHKNISLLLKSFEEPALGSLKLVLVGAEDRKAFEAAGHRIPGNVIFAGRVSDGEFRALLESALCSAFPSRTEGFGLPPLEGMCLGCPAVLAPCGALPEVGGRAALYAAADDPSQWVGAIGKLAVDRDAREQWARAGRERASLFTWSRAGEKLVDIIGEVVAEENAVRCLRR